MLRYISPHTRKVSPTCVSSHTPFYLSSYSFVCVLILVYVSLVYGGGGGPPPPVGPPAGGYGGGYGGGGGGYGGGGGGFHSGERFLFPSFLFCVVFLVFLKEIKKKICARNVAVEGVLAYIQHSACRP